MVGAKNDVVPEYALYYLSQAVQAFRYSSRGTTIAGVTKKQLKELPFPLPPLHEQRRIVAKIEEMFSDLDAGVAALKRVQAALKRYRASVLKAACEGRLVPTEADLARAEGRAYEPADVLLKRILAERRAKWEAEHPGKKYVEPAAPDAAGLPVLPEGWCWARVEQLADVVRGASPRPAGNPKYFGGSIPWITVGYLTTDEQPYLTRVATFVTEAGKAKSRYVEADTLLITNSGATLGVPKITMIAGCFNDGVVALLNVGKPLQMYLYYFLKSSTKRLRAINQGAAQPNLNTGIIKDIVVPLPPQDEQQRIVAEVERRLSVVDELEATVAANLTRASRLRQAILRRAFEGKLVAQTTDCELARVVVEPMPGAGQGRPSAEHRTNRRRNAQASLFHDL